MTTNNIPKPDALFHEAPVSWNTRYITPDGFECQLTLRGESGQEVLEKARAAIEYLLKSGSIPSGFNKGNGHPLKSNGEAANASSGDNGNDHSWCPLHQVEIRR